MDLIIISFKINLFSTWYSGKIAEQSLTHSLTLYLKKTRHIEFSMQDMSYISAIAA
jgi:hypothetical protein